LASGFSTRVAGELDGDGSTSTHVRSIWLPLDDPAVDRLIAARDPTFAQEAAECASGRLGVIGAE
jgi:hypothetical protein